MAMGAIATTCKSGANGTGSSENEPVAGAAARAGHAG